MVAGWGEVAVLDHRENEVEEPLFVAFEQLVERVVVACGVCRHQLFVGEGGVILHFLFFCLVE